MFEKVKMEEGDKRGIRFLSVGAPSAKVWIGMLNWCEPCVYWGFHDELCESGIEGWWVFESRKKAKVFLEEWDGTTDPENWDGYVETIDF